MSNFVYVYSPDGNAAYDPADRLVLARVPKDRIRERDAYEFFMRVESNGDVIWSHNIVDRVWCFQTAARFVALTSPTVPRSNDTCSS
jgi:hypothetical protein